MVEAPTKKGGTAIRTTTATPGKAAATELTPHIKPAQVGTAWIGAQRHELLIASAMLELLMVNLDAELTNDGTGRDQSADVMGVLQHAEEVLNQLSGHLLDIDGKLPDDLRWCTFRAKSIVSVVQRMTFDDAWALSCYDTTLLISCFDTAGDCIKKALRALDRMEANHV